MINLQPLKERAITELDIVDRVLTLPERHEFYRRLYSLVDTIAGEVLEGVISRVKGKHIVANSSYPSDSWDSGYHDALFELETSFVAWLEKVNPELTSPTP